MFVSILLAVLASFTVSVLAWGWQMRTDLKYSDEEYEHLLEIFEEAESRAQGAEGELVALREQSELQDSALAAAWAENARLAAALREAQGPSDMSANHKLLRLTQSYAKASTPRHKANA